MSDKIKALIVEPNKEAKLEEIDCNLKSFQKIVGGHIQDVFIDENTILVCNEEGKLCGLQPNRVFGNDVICGTFFIAGNDGGDELVSLSDEQVKQYTEMFNMEIESQSHESKELQKLFLDSLNRIFADIEAQSMDMDDTQEGMQMGDME